MASTWADRAEIDGRFSKDFLSLVWIQEPESSKETLALVTYLKSCLLPGLPFLLLFYLPFLLCYALGTLIKGYAQSIKESKGC